MFKLVSTGVHQIPGKGTVFTVSNPIELWDTWQALQHVEIDGQEYEVIAIDRFAHMPPWVVGEPIGLVVDTKPVTD